MDAKHCVRRPPLAQSFPQAMSFAEPLRGYANSEHSVYDLRNELSACACAYCDDLAFRFAVADKKTGKTCSIYLCDAHLTPHHIDSLLSRRAKTP